MRATTLLNKLLGIKQTRVESLVFGFTDCAATDVSLVIGAAPCP